MTPLRLVLDSNVVISALLFDGAPARVIQHLLRSTAQGFVSGPILDEIHDVLRRPKFRFSLEQTLHLVEEIRALCQVVSPTKSVRVIAADPDDNAVLECAEKARADVIVSGDAHLLELREWNGIRILSPADILRELDGKG